MAQKEIVLAGLFDVSIKAPTDPSGQWVKIPYATDASYKGSVSSVDILGDDALQGVYYHTQKGQITVKANQLATEVMAKISGNTVSSGNTTNPLAGSGTAEIMPFQTLGELTPPIVAVRATMHGTRPDGSQGTLTAYWYRCTCQTAFESFPSPSYGKLDEVTLTLNAYYSLFDENNVALSEGSFGRVEVY